MPEELVLHGGLARASSAALQLARADVGHLADERDALAAPSLGAAMGGRPPEAPHPRAGRRRQAPERR
eukprot:6726755-Alexandrium_andersonii.AAC.1